MTAKSSDTRRREILEAEKRQAADSRDVAGICTAYVRTAHQILLEFPSMSAEEKHTHYVRLKQDIEQLKSQANQDCSKVLGELERMFS